jgi:hypothetical protein
VGLLLERHALERGELRLGENAALLGDVGFERLQAGLHRQQILSQPDTAHAPRRDAAALFRELIGHLILPPGRLLERERHDRLFQVARDTIMQIGFPTGDLAQGLSPPVSYSSLNR